MNSSQQKEVVYVPVVALVNKNGEALLTSRPHGKSGIAEGFFEFPGGKVDLDEGVVDAAIREIQEELDVTISCDHITALPFLINEWIRPDGRLREAVILPFLCTKWDGEPKGMEGQTLKWVKVEDLSSPETRKTFLEKGGIILDYVQEAAFKIKS